VALQKKFTDKTGAQVQYWIIANVSMDKLSESGSVTLTGYMDQQTRLDHPSEGIIQRKTVAIPTADFKPIYDDVVNNGAEPYTELYNYVKNNATDANGELMFDGATDV